MTPPLASSSARPATWRTASRSCVDRHVVEQDPRRAPPAERLVDLGERRGTRPRAAARARAARAWRTASPTPPASAAWFSLIRIASYRPARWLVPPPAATAAFSSARSPGVVLRVSRIRAPVPSTACTQRAVSVATPDSRWRKFSAVRSAVRIAARRPLEPQHRAALAPLALCASAARPRSPGRATRNVSLGDVEPEHDARRLLGDQRAGRAPRSGTVAAVVTSPSPTSSASARATISVSVALATDSRG